MIRIQLAYLVIIYLLAMLALISVFWLAYESRHRLRRLRSQRHLVRCTTCHGIYRDSSDIPTPACPYCGSLNERDRIQRV